jgi:hypothetical protein
MFILEFQFQVPPDGLHDKISLFEHTIAVDNLRFPSSGFQDAPGPQDHDAKPVLESIDGQDQYISFKDTYLLGPSLDVLVVLFYFVVDQTHQVGGLSVVYYVFSCVFAYQFLHEEGRVEEALVLEVGRQEDEVEHLQVVAHDSVVEVGLGLQLVHVLHRHWEGLRLLPHTDRELFLADLQWFLGEENPVNLFSTSAYFLLLLFFVFLEQVFFPLGGELVHFEVDDLHLQTLINLKIWYLVKD